jgi:hypothetical protein
VTVLRPSGVMNTIAWHVAKAREAEIRREAEREHRWAALVAARAPRAGRRV